MRVNREVWFCAQQMVAHEWAVDVHLTPEEAVHLMCLLAEDFGVPHVRLLWELGPLLDDNHEAVTFQHTRLGVSVVAFGGCGTTLFMLCHELAHAWRAWDEGMHDDVDWDVATILLEECRGRV